MAAVVVVWSEIRRCAVTSFGFSFKCLIGTLGGSFNIIAPNKSSLITDAEETLSTLVINGCIRSYLWIERS